ncbi:hypothetical protein MTR_8g052530, partial [Medicago truncatula]
MTANEIFRRFGKTKMTANEITTGTAIDFNKPFKFHGTHFKRWQTKMQFFLTTKKVAYVLNDAIPVIPTLSIPTASNSNGVTAMDTDVSDPTKKV